jgi:hypothetical protein
VYTCGREVLKLLTEEQLDRYEAFRRSSLSKANMKRVRQERLHHQPGCSA